MSNPEFSDSFDILYNNIMSNAAPGLSEYEKSVFLTNAQLEILKNYFNSKGNKYQEGFDDSPKRLIDFSALIVTSVGLPSATVVASFDKRSKLYKLPSDVFFILNESIETQEGTKLVIPIYFEEYTRLMSKPYKEPFKFHAWRLVSRGDSDNDIIAEIIPKTGDTISKYLIRYIRRPKPIILTDLSSYNGASIDGITTETLCELNSVLHREILNRAVELAKVAYQGDVALIVNINQRSE